VRPPHLLGGDEAGLQISRIPRRTFACEESSVASESSTVNGVLNSWEACRFRSGLLLSTQ